MVDWKNIPSIASWNLTSSGQDGFKFWMARLIMLGWRRWQRILVAGLLGWEGNWKEAEITWITEIDQSRLDIQTDCFATCATCVTGVNCATRTIVDSSKFWRTKFLVVLNISKANADLPEKCYLLSEWLQFSQCVSFLPWSICCQVKASVGTFYKAGKLCDV